VAYFKFCERKRPKGASAANSSLLAEAMAPFGAAFLDNK
jgi:hypothetical protein